MNIGGYMPFSLSDYPGCPAAIVFTQGCNFRCPFCHNDALIEIKAGSIPATEVLSSLVNRRKFLQGVVISGGEPCLQNAIESFCASIKEMGLRVKLDTNGSRPDVLIRLINADYVDYVAMDVKAPPDRYHVLSGVEVHWNTIEESIRVLAASGIPHHFRTTNVTALLSAEDIDEIVGHLPLGSKHILQDFRRELAHDPRLRDQSAQNEVCTSPGQYHETETSCVN